MSAAQPILWHIAVSHYSEKVRWALDHKGIEHERRSPPPGLHMPVVLWLTRGRSYTLPAMDLGGRRLADSTAIIAALEERYPEPPLYPSDPDERGRALALEDWFDEELAPYARRLVFHELGRDRERLERSVAKATPALYEKLGRGAVAYARMFTKVRTRASVPTCATAAGWRWVQEMFRRHRRRERAPAPQDVGAAA
jgi:glutathione S-transferase